MKKKSYNPLKMAGAWIGLVLGIIFSLIHSFFEGVGSLSGGSYGAENAGTPFLAVWQEYWLILILMYWVTFFLIGWGIHSLIRRLRR